MPVHVQVSRAYDPSWLPPPVNVSGEQKTYKNSSQPETGKPILKNTNTEEYTSLSELRNLIHTRLAEKFVYPERARNRSIEGTVYLLLDISQTGVLLDCRQSGNAPVLLVQAAVHQMEQIFPLSVHLEKPLSGFSVSITYKLE